jgi:hypothetical protein
MSKPKLVAYYVDEASGYMTDTLAEEPRMVYDTVIYLIVEDQAGLITRYLLWQLPETEREGEWLFDFLEDHYEFDRSKVIHQANRQARVTREMQDQARLFLRDKRTGG